MIESLIVDKEIDVEVGWILLRQSEKEKAELIKQVEANTKLYSTIELREIINKCKKELQIK